MTEYAFNKFQWYFLQFISWLALFISFVVFEETVIDRSNIWQTLPGYRVGDPCVWDLGAAFVCAVVVFFVFRQKKVKLLEFIQKIK